MYSFKLGFRRQIAVFGFTDYQQQLSSQYFPFNNYYIQKKMKKWEPMKSSCFNLTFSDSDDKMCATWLDGWKGFIGNNLKSTLGTPLICNGELQGFI